MTLELFLDFFEDPPLALRRVWSDRPVGAALLAYGLAGSGLLFAQAFLMPLPSARWLPWALALWWAWEAAEGLLSSAAAHFAAEAMGARASGGGLFVLFGLGELVWALAVPAVLILEALKAPGSAQLLALAALGALRFFVRARAVQGHYGLSGGRAAAAVLAPYALVGSAVLLSFIVGVWTLAALAHAAFS